MSTSITEGIAVGRASSCERFERLHDGAAHGDRLGFADQGQARLGVNRAGQIDLVEVEVQQPSADGMPLDVAEHNGDGLGRAVDRHRDHGVAVDRAEDALDLGQVRLDGA